MSEHGQLSEVETLHRERLVVLNARPPAATRALTRASLDRWIEGRADIRCMRNCARIVTTLLLTACVACTPAHADSPYPEHALRLVVPFTPAGATDMLARLVGERLSLRLGQPVVVDNRPGASGNNGAALVANAAPDGYTLLMAPISIYAISATLYSQLNYDLIRSFAPVSLVANVPHVLVANPELNVRSVQELIALAKKRPGQLNLANQGNGSVSHLEGEMFKHMAGLELTNIPYSGSAPAMLDLTAGRVHVMFDSIASALPHIQAGRLRALGVTATTRSSLLAQVPTIEETGLKGYSAESLLGILVPVHTPRSVIERLNRELVALLQERTTRERLAAAGFEPISCSAGELGQRMRADLAKWAAIVKASGATLN